MSSWSHETFFGRADCFFPDRCTGLFGSDLSENRERSLIQKPLEQKGERTEEAQLILKDYGPAPELTHEVWLNNNRYWPSLYLIDKWGNIRYKHIGEGRYEETEAAIQTLLAEAHP